MKTRDLIEVLNFVKLAGLLQQLHPGATVFKATPATDVVRTVQGGETIGNLPIPDSWYLFIDQCPFANWAHECAYVLIGENLSYKWINAEWPPEEGTQLIHLIEAPPK